MFITDKPLYTEKEGDYILFIRLSSFMGCINGYIGVPMYSRYANEHYDDIPFGHIVHGGLTYSAYEEIDGQDYWVFGFDTAHAGDAPFVQTDSDESAAWVIDRIINGQGESHVWDVNEVMEQLYMLLEEFKKGEEQYGY